MHADSIFCIDSIIVDVIRCDNRYLLTASDSRRILLWAIFKPILRDQKREPAFSKWC